MSNYIKYFHTHVQKTYPSDFKEIILFTESHYKEIAADIAFVKTSGNPVDKRLDFCAYFLSMIKTLDQRNIAFEDIRQLCLEITIDYVQPRNKLHAFIKKLIPKLTNTFPGKMMIKMFAKKVGQNASTDGFIANIITDKDQTFGLGYGIDILECGICKLFKKHHYSKFAPILCEVDE